MNKYRNITQEDLDNMEFPFECYTQAFEGSEFCIMYILAMYTTDGTCFCVLENATRGIATYSIEYVLQYYKIKIPEPETFKVKFFVNGRGEIISRHPMQACSVDTWQEIEWVDIAKGEYQLKERD